MIRSRLGMFAVIVVAFLLDPVASDIEKAKELSKLGACKYCKYCDFCHECSTCPCSAEDVDPLCVYCKYCKYCSMCKLCQACKVGGILDTMMSGFDSLMQKIGVFSEENPASMMKDAPDMESIDADLVKHRGWAPETEL
eukprot:TRINITY_DN43996_c0_g1_i1.p2 TRINITY_DN43996_c0_g1~~TRINITY_DN43996_c0_g1_i1.p2  ORF type:complete len:139 (-),score=20.77 TRINITY_DN43996_c0_g1_i1:81-497(-)